MKKMLLFCVLTVQIFGQMDFSQFNKIGFSDLYYLSKISGNSSLAGESYYILLKELGLTHLATLADDIPINNYGLGLKILDRNFEWPGYVHPDSSNYNAFVYSLAMGNKNEIPYEIGGAPLGSTFEFEQDNLWAFGTNVNSSIWQMNDSCTTGDQNKLDDNVKVAFADTNDSNHQIGTLVYLLTSPEHSVYSILKRSNNNYKIFYRAGLLMRVDKRNDIPDTAKILTIRVFEILEKSKNENPEYTHWQLNNQEVIQDDPQLDDTFYVYNNQFSNSFYTEILTPYFFKKNGKDSRIVIDVIWNKRCNVYIDKAYIFNQFYDSLFVESAPVISQTKTKIYNSSIPNTGHPNYAHSYFDEPMPLQYYGQQFVSQIWDSAHGKFIKGADQFFHNADLGLINYLHASNRPKYILSDCYPLHSLVSNYSTVDTNSLQAAFTLLTDSSELHYYNRYHRYGLRQMINWAHNFFPNHLNNISEHIPFYHTIQCQGEVCRDESGNATLNLRRPTYNEILAQGWLAMCYGAKGLMYYDMHTETTYNPNSNDSGYYLYGLFDSNSFTTNSQGDLIYDAQAQQFPNERYYAVKELNSQIDTISSTLMNLTWYDGYSLHKGGALSGTYINSISSWYESPKYNDTIYDPTHTSFVELGLFRKSTEPNNTNLEYFMVVNRRCLTSEGRYLDITLNKDTSGFRNWKVTDIATNLSQVVMNNGTFRTYLEPGRGKLFRLEPVMITGGTLAYNETVPQNTSIQVKGSLTVPSGKSLTVGSGASLTFQNESKLHIYGDLEVNGTSSGKVTFDFVQNSQTNAIKLYSGSSAIIDHAIIKNAEYGINVNQGSLLIQNSEIKDCDVGIYMYGNSYINDETEISYCNIHDNNFWGIELNYSTPLIRNNYISGGSKGVVCLNNSSAFLGKGGTEGFNNIVDVECGIYAYSSDPFLGNYDEKHQAEAGGYNSIVGENYNAHVEMDSYVSANLNWWGTPDPQGETFLQEDGGVIDYDYYLDYSPFGESQTPEEGGEEILVKGKTGQITLESMTTKAKYEKAVIHYLKNRKAEARVYCNSILDEEVENRLKYPALRLLVRCMDEDSVRTNVIGKINNTLLTTAQTDYNAYLEMTLADIVRSNYLTSLDGIMTKYRNTTYKPLILFRKFSYLYFEEENRDSARVIAEMMESQYPDHELTKSAKMMFGVTTLKKETEETSIIPKEYKLYQNYPNPFNPVTTIKYELPANSKVTLTIYDILGKEVTKLVDKEQESGKYQITFDAKRYASGVYICRIVTGDFVKTIKMSLVK